MHTAIVKLDTLTDSVRPPTKDHNFLAICGCCFAFGIRQPITLVGRVHVGRLGRELGSAGVDAFVNRTNSGGSSTLGHHGFVGIDKFGETGIGEAEHFEFEQTLAVPWHAILANILLGRNDPLDVAQEPGIDG